MKLRIVSTDFLALHLCCFTYTPARPPNLIF